MSGWFLTARLWAIKLWAELLPPNDAEDATTIPPGNAAAPAGRLPFARLFRITLWLAPSSAIPVPETGGPPPPGQRRWFLRALLWRRLQSLTLPGAPVLTRAIPRQFPTAWLWTATACEESR